MPADAQEISAQENLVGILSERQKYLAAMGPGYSLYAEQLAGLTQRLCEGRFHLAVLGQVKRGKSTLINALLGEDVLPSSVVPLTAIPTFIRYGKEKGIRVRYNDSRLDAVFAVKTAPDLNRLLRGFVTEEENPENRKGVREVGISSPAAILRDVVLIDTPGIGSTYRHNTEATMNFLPQCDAALFVISADPPITEVEVTFLREIKNRVAHLFFVLNKVDYLTDTEREMAFGFYRTVLIRDAGIDPRIFATSARKGLQAKESGDTQQWEKSGLAEVFDHLIAFLAREKNRVLRDAIGRKALDVFHEVQLQIGLEMQALELPLAEIETRLSLFDKKIAEAKEQRIHARDILTGDQKRVHAQLEAHVESLRIPLRERLTDIAESAITASPQDPEDAAQHAVADAIPAWFERELGRITFVMDGEVASRLKDHEERADDLIESIRTAAAELFGIPYHSPKGERAYDPVRKPYWVEHDWDSSCSPLPALVISRLLPRSLRESQARNRTKKLIDTLVMRNLENLRWETLQTIDMAFRKFGADLDTNLGLTIEATHGAIRLALSQRKRCEAEGAERLFQLKKAAAEMQEVIRQFEAVQKRS